MVRYFFMLFILTFCSVSSPAPATVISYLNKLKENCGDEFLSSQIAAKIEDCSSMDQFNRKQSQCILFYEINKSLCTSATKYSNAWNLSIPDFLQKVNTLQNINTFCTDIKNLHSKYVFDSTAKCVIACADENILNSNIFDTNFFCKYYKVGSELLTLLPAMEKNTTVDNVSVVSSTNLNIGLPDNKGIELMESANNKQTIFNVAGNNTKDLSQADTVNNVTSNSSVVVVHSENQSKEKASDSATSEMQKNLNKTTVIDKTLKDSKINQEQTSDSQIQTKNNQLIDTNINVEETKDGEANVVNDNEENLEYHKHESIDVDGISAIENPKRKSDFENDDYPDSQDGLADTQGDDDGDGSPNQNGNDQVEPAEQDQIAPNRIDTPVLSYNVKTASKKIAAEDSFAEDDDHFFPFFLTAVVSVIVLYILYHNKTKLTKLVLGLIVEGRQTGHRRNSRGHAYRKLDTLEQAMNTSTSTPPSKIIY